MCVKEGEGRQTLAAGKKKRWWSECLVARAGGDGLKWRTWGGAMRGMGLGLREGSGARPGLCRAVLPEQLLWELGAVPARAPLCACGGSEGLGSPERALRGFSSILPGEAAWAPPALDEPRWIRAAARAAPAGSSVPVRAEQGNIKFILTPARSASSCCGRNMGEDSHSPCVRRQATSQSQGIPWKLLSHRTSCYSVTSGANKMPNSWTVIPGSHLKAMLKVSTQLFHNAVLKKE